MQKKTEAKRNVASENNRSKKRKPVSESSYSCLHQVRRFRPRRRRPQHPGLLLGARRNHGSGNRGERSAADGRTSFSFLSFFLDLGKLWWVGELRASFCHHSRSTLTVKLEISGEEMTVNKIPRL